MKAKGHIGTLFHGARFKHCDWKGPALRADVAFLPGEPLVRPADALARLNIPFERVDAACVNPLDPDVVWIFSGKKVVDFRVSERRPLTYCTGDPTVTVTLWNIAEHPIFCALPSTFHDGITAAVVDDGDVPGREEFGAIVHVYRGDQLAPLHVSSLRTAQWLYVTYGELTYVLFGHALRLDEWWNKLTGPFRVRPGLGALTCVANVAGSSSGETWQFSDDKFTRSSQEPPVLSKRDGWNKTFPKAAVPVELSPGSPQVRRATAGKRSTLVTPDASEPPDAFVAINGRRDARNFSSLTKDFLEEIKRLYPFEKGELLPFRVQRMNELVARIKEGDLPDFLRTFVPVRAVEDDCPGCELVYYVMPDFVSVGDEFDFVRLPLSASAAQEVAEHFDYLLPTGRMARQIYFAEGTQLIRYYSYNSTAAERNRMISTEFFFRHERDIRQEHTRRGYLHGRLTAGHKKEIVTFGKKSPLYDHVWFWGGLSDVDRDPSEGDRVVKFEVAHPKATPRSVGDTKGKPESVVLKLEAGDESHGEEKENSCGHDEYAQGTRLVSRLAYLKKKGETAWKPVDLVNDVLAVEDLYKLVSLHKVADPQDFPRYKNLSKQFSTVTIQVKGRAVKMPNRKATGAQIRDAARAQGVTFKDGERLALGAREIADIDAVAVENGQSFTSRMPRTT